MSRRRRIELRELMIDAGIDALAEDRLRLEPDTLRVRDVVEELRAAGHVVHRAQFHRLFDDVDQYRLAVVVRAIEIADAGAEEIAGNLIARATALPRANARERRAALMVLIRAADSPPFIERRNDANQRLSIAIQAIRSQATTPTDDIDAVISRRLEARRQVWTDAYRRLADLLGVRPRTSFGLGERSYEVLADHVSTLLDGVDKRRPFDPATRASVEIDGEEWTTTAVALLGLFDALLEPVDED